MLQKEIQVEIDVLHRQGKAIRAIERETGHSRNTIRAILRGLSNGQYGPRKARPTKIDNYKRYLQDRLQGAGKVWLPATVLLREIRAQGYDGGITRIKGYLREIRPAPPDEPIVRFETEPGRQLQIDFVVFRRGELPLRAFTAELGFSRYSYVELPAMSAALLSSPVLNVPYTTSAAFQRTCFAITPRRSCSSAMLSATAFTGIIRHGWIS
jgi:transposase